MIDGEYFPLLSRYLHFGVPWGDLLELRAAPDYAAWSVELARRADRYAQLAATAAQAGRLLSAVSLYENAVACFHYAQIRLPPGAEKQSLQQRTREVFVALAPLATPPVEPLRIPFRGGGLPALLRVAGEGAPCVVLLNGLDSAKEVELHRFGQGFVARGLSTLAFDAPGIGESAGSLADFDEALRAVIAHVERRVGRLGVFGVSFGGYLAGRALALPGVDAVVSLGGFFDWRAMERLPLAAAANLRRAYGLAADAPLDSLRALIDLGPLRAREVPFVVFHGDCDHLVDMAQIDRLQAWAPHADVRVLRGGEHVGTNRFAEVLPLMWDFMAERLR